MQKAGFRGALLSGLRVNPGATLAEDVTLTSVDGGGLELGGIGVSLAKSDVGLVMAGVGPGDPAAKVGLVTGDRIVSIDGESTEGMSLADAVQRLRGEIGTSVGVSVQRAARRAST